jgi:hypothetical protein
MHFLRDSGVSPVLESTAVLGSGVLLRSTDCIHAVVRAGLPCSHEKITIFRGTLKLHNLFLY